jgi:pheromone a factor receptor
MALATTEILLTTPLAIFIIWLDATALPVEPWRGWADTHLAFSRVEQIPALFWRTNHLVVVSLELSRWVTPLCAFVFFGYFGFGDEARKHYRLVFWALVKPFGFSPSPKTSGSNVYKYAIHVPYIPLFILLTFIFL